MSRFFFVLQSLLLVFFVSACSKTLNDKLYSGKDIFQKTINKVSNKKTLNIAKTGSPIYKPLEELLVSRKKNIDLSNGFKLALKSAVESDPEVIGDAKDLLADKAAIEKSESFKEFQIDGQVLGGLEDVSDKTSGVAVVLSAKRMLFDGGQLDAQISTETLAAKSKEFLLEAKMNEKAVELATFWIDLDKYLRLNDLIQGRLEVLAPLMVQLETVAEAGIGDVAQVAAAKRTVTLVKTTEKQVQSGFEQARINFKNSFGSVPVDVSYDEVFISNLLPNKLSESLINSSPAIRADYFAYKATIANKFKVEAQGGFDVGFEARATAPFAGSGYESDESVGLVIRKTIYNGGLVDSEVQQAEMIVQAAQAKLLSTHAAGEKIITTALQQISLLSESNELAAENARVMRDEIVQLRQQLLIGGSTLESVLSAEAKLYDVEAQEINLIAERRKAELAVVGTFGLLTSALGIDASTVLK